MIPFPDISPEIFTVYLGNFELALRWYAVSYIAGFIAATYLMKRYLRSDHLWRYNTPPMEVAQVDSLITYLILGVIIGGRLGYVLFYNLSFYLDQPFHILRLWDGGMSFHGGFVGVVLSVIFFCRFNGIPLLAGADLIAISSPPGLMFGRIANFINAELWGRPTEVSWGVIFPGFRAQDCPGVVGECARHATQLYEAALEGFFLFIILIICAKIGSLKRPGLIAGLFVFGYGLIRFFLEFYRVADPQFISIENPIGYAFQFLEYGVTMGQALSIPMILLGLLFVIKGLLFKASN